MTIEKPHMHILHLFLFRHMTIIKFFYVQN